MSLVSLCIKILINNGSPFRAYHHPQDVVIRSKTNTVGIIDDDGSILETHVLVKKEVKWIENKDLDASEILVTLHVM